MCAVSTPLAGWGKDISPYHPGEQAAQERVGMRQRMEQAGRRVIRPFMPDQHRAFFAELPFVLVGSLDARHRPWASLLVGRPGFAHSPDPLTLEIDARPAPGDPLHANLVERASVGVLGIQLETRRRNRMNGTIAAVREHGYTLHVEQTFGNCAQYIQKRESVFLSDRPAASVPHAVRLETRVLSDAGRRLVESADTFFVATASAGAAVSRDAPEGVDVSHRGGRAGFVRVSEEAGRTVLTSPDFRGNFFFNTLGNILVNPQAGLLFIDFDTGNLLSLTGDAEVVWDGPEVASFAGAQRLLRFRLSEGVLMQDAMPFRWSAPIYAPQLADPML
jgi:uncharacterized protein